ncbi:MAG: hypothetical protein RAP03_04775 [Candidatus Electryonea clarkiae]|nr:hypothetical protein [Candidatus Electryonea clarkiae]
MIAIFYFAVAALSFSQTVEITYPEPLVIRHVIQDGSITFLGAADACEDPNVNPDENIAWISQRGVPMSRMGSSAEFEWFDPCVDTVVAFCSFATPARRVIIAMDGTNFLQPIGYSAPAFHDSVGNYQRNIKGEEVMIEILFEDAAGNQPYPDNVDTMFYAISPNPVFYGDRTGYPGGSIINPEIVWYGNKWHARWYIALPDTGMYQYTVDTGTWAVEWPHRWFTCPTLFNYYSIEPDIESISLMTALPEDETYIPDFESHLEWPSTFDSPLISTTGGDYHSEIFKRPKQSGQQNYPYANLFLVRPIFTGVPYIDDLRIMAEVKTSLTDNLSGVKSNSSTNGRKLHIRTSSLTNNDIEISDPLESESTYIAKSVTSTFLPNTNDEKIQKFNFHVRWKYKVERPVSHQNQYVPPEGWNNFDSDYNTNESTAIYMGHKQPTEDDLDTLGRTGPQMLKFVIDMLSDVAYNNPEYYHDTDEEIMYLLFEISRLDKRYRGETLFWEVPISDVMDMIIKNYNNNSLNPLEVNCVDMAKIYGWYGKILGVDNIQALRIVPPNTQYCIPAIYLNLHYPILENLLNNNPFYLSSNESIIKNWPYPYEPERILNPDWTIENGRSGFGMHCILYTDNIFIQNSAHRLYDFDHLYDATIVSINPPSDTIPGTWQPDSLINVTGEYYDESVRDVTFPYPKSELSQSTYERTFRNLFVR